MSRKLKTLCIGLVVVVAIGVAWWANRTAQESRGNRGESVQTSSDAPKDHPDISGTTAVSDKEPAAPRPPAPNEPQNAKPSSTTVSPAAPAISSRPNQAVTPTTVTSVQPAKLSDPALKRVEPIVNGALGDARFRERAMAVRATTTELTEAEIAAFYRFLQSPPQDPANFETENWLRNEMMDKLVQQSELPRGFADLLMNVYRDGAQDVVMRDYAIQHIGPTYARVSNEEKERLREAMWQATGETDSSIAGTALLTLLDLGDAAMDRRQLAVVALKLARDESCGELARITAVQACGRLGLKEGLAVATELAQRGSSVPLRLAAIAALGDAADEPLRGVLQRLSTDTDPRIKRASESALRRLNARLVARNRP